MLNDWELWACANQILGLHGERSSAFVAERIKALTLQGDETGVIVWKAISMRIAQLGQTKGPLQ